LVGVIALVLIFRQSVENPFKKAGFVTRRKNGHKTFGTGAKIHFSQEKYF